MNNAEKFEQNLLKSSVSNNLDAAKREWRLLKGNMEILCE